MLEEMLQERKGLLICRCFYTFISV